LESPLESTQLVDEEDDEISNGGNSTAILCEECYGESNIMDLYMYRLDDNPFTKYHCFTCINELCALPGFTWISPPAWARPSDAQPSASLDELDELLKPEDRPETPVAKGVRKRTMLFSPPSALEAKRQHTVDFEPQIFHAVAKWGGRHFVFMPDSYVRGTGPEAKVRLRWATWETYRNYFYSKYAHTTIWSDFATAVRMMKEGDLFWHSPIYDYLPARPGKGLAGCMSGDKHNEGEVWVTWESYTKNFQSHREDLSVWLKMDSYNWIRSTLKDPWQDVLAKLRTVE
jgi:hypothetical protein